MNRIERLTAILLLLQGGKRSAREIAHHFAISIRTAQRDIDLLCEMGIPIAAAQGTSGGYSLPPDYSVPPFALSLREALLLRLALSSLSQLGGTPFKQEGESLLTKIQVLLAWQRDEDLNQTAPLSPQLLSPAPPIVHVHPSFPEIRIDLTTRGVLRLEREPHLASHIQLRETGAGLLTMRLRMEEYDWLVCLLLALGTDARVLAPEELCLRVKREAQEIARHYTGV